MQLKAEVTWDLSKLTSSNKEDSTKASFEFVKCLQEQVKFKTFIRLQNDSEFQQVLSYFVKIYS